MARLVPKIPRSKRSRKLLTRAEACSRAQRDHERAIGKKFVVDEVDGYINDDSTTCGPAVVRVRKTAPSDICRVMDDFVDPVWDVEVVTGDDTCRRLRSAWVYGPTYNLKPRKRSR
jgi:hypothetical protein